MEEENDVSTLDDDTVDTMKILIATDIHLGYGHNQRRGRELNDSFTTFEEILKYGVEHEVDFILLGGDLFHDTKPSQTALLKCMDLLRRYCFGTRQSDIQFLSDPKVIFSHCAYKTVNFEDSNFNVSMPVFSIHGNHDDPNFGAVGSMDLLSVPGFVNYFGKWTDLTKITIPPLIIKKGKTHVALYGLSYINDQRLSRLFRDMKVDMLRPEELPDCFNIFVLHQNRVKHDDHGYIPEHNLPDFLNLIIWGHEHECRIVPEFIPSTGYYISQPGSSIATSLCEGEAKPKYVGLLSVNKKRFKMQKLKLKTVRPFIFDNLILSDEKIPRDYTQSLSQAVYEYVDDYIENVLMPKAAELLTGHPMQPIEPFLRLRIFYSKDDEIFDTNSLCEKYFDEVANPKDVILFRKEKSVRKDSKSDSHDNMEIEDTEYVFDEDIDWSKSVQHELKKYFNNEKNKDILSVLSINGLNEALTRFINRKDLDAFQDILTHQSNKTVAVLETKDANTEETIIAEIKKFRNERREKEKEEQEELREVFTDSRRKRKPVRKEAVQEDVFTLTDSDEDGLQVDKGTGRGRGRGKAGTRGTRARGRGSRGGRGRAGADDANIFDALKTSTSRTTQKQASKQNPSSRSRSNFPFIIDDSD